MDICINLLPEEKKNKIKRKKRVIAIIKQELIFFFVAAFLGVILLNINFILKFQLAGLEKDHSIEQSQDKYQELGRNEEKFKEINSKTALLYNIEKNHLYWSELFLNLDKTISQGVLINNISNVGYNVSLSGRAGKRENLLKFQENLNSSECFSEVNVPLSDLVTKENVIFKIDLKMKENCLKR